MGLPGELQQRVAIREDPDQPATIRDKEAVDVLALHPIDHRIDIDGRVHGARSRCAELGEVDAQERAVDTHGRRGHIGGAQIRAAVLAQIVALVVLRLANRANHAPSPVTVQVSPPASSLARSPLPRVAMACSSWATRSSAWVGRSIARITPTGTGKSGQ